MKRVIVRQNGGPEVMGVEEVTTGYPGPGEIKVRNHAIGVNYTDIYSRVGDPTPHTPGKEGAGVVIEVGPQVEDFQVGDRVVYTQSPGSYGEEHIVLARLTLHLLESFDYDTAAAITLKGLTAHYLIHDTYPVKAGDTVFVHAAAGGVGSIMTQWLKSKGATVIGSVGSEEKAELARANGVDYIIEHRKEDIVDAVMKYTEGKGCDVVYDGVGQTTKEASLSILRPFGYYVNFGNASGPVSLEMWELAAHGSLYATFPDLDHFVGDEQHFRKMGQDLFDVIESGIIKVQKPRTFVLEEVVEAHKYLESRQSTGSIILIPSHE